MDLVRQNKNKKKKHKMNSSESEQGKHQRKEIPEYLLSFVFLRLLD
jgi:hypothetical protein